MSDERKPYSRPRLEDFDHVEDYYLAALRDILAELHGRSDPQFGESHFRELSPAMSRIAALMGAMTARRTAMEESGACSTCGRPMP